MVALLTSPRAPPSANQSSSSQAIRARGTAGKYGKGGMEGEKHQDVKCTEVCGWVGDGSAEREDHLARWIIAQQEAGGSIENQAESLNEADDEARQLTESEGSKSKPVCFLFSKTLLPIPPHPIPSRRERSQGETSCMLLDKTPPPWQPKVINSISSSLPCSSTHPAPAQTPSPDC